MLFLHLLYDKTLQQEFLKSFRPIKETVSTVGLTVLNTYRTFQLNSHGLL